MGTWTLPCITSTCVVQAPQGSTYCQCLGQGLDLPLDSGFSINSDSHTTALLMFLCACSKCELYIQYSWYINSYRVTHVRAYVHWCVYAMMSFIHEVSCEVTSPIHLCVCVNMNLNANIHRALYSSSPANGNFPRGWLYDAPALLFVHIRGSNYVITTLDLWFEVQKLCWLSIS